MAMPCASQHYAGNHHGRKYFYHLFLFQGLGGSLSDSDTAALVDMDMDGNAVLGIDNVGLDFTDLDFIMDENSQKILNGDYSCNGFTGRVNSPVTPCFAPSTHLFNGINLSSSDFSGILPESPPDSSSEHCLSSPTYMNSSLLSPPELALNTQDLSSNLYHDPVMYQLHSPTDLYPIRHAGLHDKPANNIPDLCTVDYSQPLQIVEAAQVQSNNFSSAHIKSTSLPQRLEPGQFVQNEGQIVTIPVRNQPLKHPFSDQGNTRLTVRTGAFNGMNNNNNNNNSVTFLSPNDRSINGRSQSLQRDPSEVPVVVQETIKQEPVGSPPTIKLETDLTASKLGHKKKRRRENSFPHSEDTSSESVSPVKIKSESECDQQTQNVQFLPFEPSSWSSTCSSDFKKLQCPILKVSADKGFNFSQLDDAFIAQKKNHFQLTCHVFKDGQHDFISTQEGYKPLEYLQLNFYGIKKEAPDQKIPVSKPFLGSSYIK